METVEAHAAIAIPYPSAKRAAAVEAIANYLRMLRDWTATRYAVAGDGAGNVALTNRHSYIYARLGDAAGDIIEAKLINVLEPQNNDALLVRRETPGGAGGWLVLDTLAAVVTRRNCGAGQFWIQLDGWAIFRVETVAVSGSAGTLVNETLSDDYTLLWLASGGANEISVMLDDGVSSFGTSSDGGSSFAVTPFTDNVDTAGNYWRTMEADLSDANYLWAIMPSYFDPYPTGGYYCALYYTTDGGASWTQIDLIIHAVNHMTGAAVVAARQDGGNAFAIVSEVEIAAPGVIDDVYIWLLGSDPDAGIYTFDAAQVAMLNDMSPFWGCVRYGDTDNFYFLVYDEMRLFRFTWSTKSLTDLGLVDGNPGVNYQKQIVSTRAGTLLIPAAPFGGTPFLYVYRSTDGGATWDQIDLTSLLPATREMDTWDYIAVSNNDMLAIAIQGEGGGDGYLLFSTDDGATWQQSDVFIPMGAYGRPIDICGEGL